MQVLLNNIIIDTDQNKIGKSESAVIIESQSMAVLSYLIANADKLVTKDMLQAEIWRNKVVTDNSMHRVIAILRKALRDQGDNDQFIKTIHGKGYVLVAEVSEPRRQHIKVKLGVTATICCAFFITVIANWYMPGFLPGYHRIG